MRIVEIVILLSATILVLTAVSIEANLGVIFPTILAGMLYKGFYMFFGAFLGVLALYIIVQIKNKGQ